VSSIRAQTYPNIEIILLNDGSSDNNVSLEVCDMFRKIDPRITLVDKDNSGVSDTRNLGLKLAAGKYVQFVDSDDWLDPSYTADLVEHAEKNNADLVIAHYQMVIPRSASSMLERLSGNEPIEVEPEIRSNGFLPECVLTKNEFALHLMDKPASFYYGVLWNKLYRRDILVEHEISFSSDLHWSEDFLFNLQYIRYAEVFSSTENAGYFYMQNPQSICHTAVNPASIAHMKASLFPYYKDLYEHLGLYEDNRLAIYKYLVDISESTLPTSALQQAMQDAKATLRELTEESESLLIEE
jgi:glycosyltransferase involved in cell wall biosynthesis